MVETLIERLRDADAKEQKKAWKSGIFGEAADRIEALEREKEELRKERDDLAQRAAVIDEALTNAIQMRTEAERQLAEIDAHRRKVLAENERLLNAFIEKERQIAKKDAALGPLARLEIPTRPVGNAGAYSIRHADIESARAALAGSGDRWRDTCATEGCGRRAFFWFERGGVGTRYCYDCYMRVQSLPATPSTAGER